MDVREVTLRAVGILTHARDLMHNAERGQGNAEHGPSGSPLEAFLEEVFTPVEVSADASPQEVAAAMSDVVRPAVVGLLTGFAFAFSELAEIHDAGRTDISSDEVLRALALRMSQGDDSS